MEGDFLSFNKYKRLLFICILLMIMLLSAACSKKNNDDSSDSSIDVSDASESSDPSGPVSDIVDAPEPFDGSSDSSDGSDSFDNPNSSNSNSDNAVSADSFGGTSDINVNSNNTTSLADSSDKSTDKSSNAINTTSSKDSSDKSTGKGSNSSNTTSSKGSSDKSTGKSSNTSNNTNSTGSTGKSTGNGSNSNNTTSSKSNSGKPSSKGTNTSEKARIIAIDAGHQGKGNYQEEPIGPGAKKTKPKVTSGTQGISTGVPEYKLTLVIAKKVKEELINRGYEIVMIRDSHDVNLSNKERAEIANESGADLFLRIHADGSENSNVSGVSTLYPSKDNPYVSKLSKSSYALSKAIVDGICDSTGAKNRGAIARDDMSGINWCTIPVSIIEMGYMSNKAEDKNMQTEDYQNKIVEGICNGIDDYYSSKE